MSGSRSFGLTHDDVSRWTLVSGSDATWRGRTHYAVELSGDSRVCVSGGTFIGTWPRDTSWKHMHGTGAIVLDGPRATVEDVTVHGYGDSIRMLENASHFVVRRVHLSFSRDDCIENDWLLSGTVTGSLLDGCYNAFSARSYQDVPDGDDHVWTIRSSLVRLEPMPRTYHDEKPIPGTAGFFKWDMHGPQLVLEGQRVPRRPGRRTRRARHPGGQAEELLRQHDGLARQGPLPRTPAELLQAHPGQGRVGQGRRKLARGERLTPTATHV